MHRHFLDRWVVAGLLVVLAGCADLPRERGTPDVDEMIVARGVPSPAWPTEARSASSDEARVAELLSQPLTSERAVQLAFLKNPRIQVEYARLGITQADLYEASRVTNPTFGYVDLSASGEGGSQLTRSISLSFADLLLLRARTRLARAEIERVRHTVAAALIELATEVETAWYEYVSAKQVATMREAVAQAAANSAEFAQRSFDAGNIAPRNLALELAAESEARIAATRTAAEAVRARTVLAGVLGISSREQWDTPRKLPAPLANDGSQDSLITHALESRLDLEAVRREVSLLEDALGVTHRWRYLGAFRVGYERENETDGAHLHGPTLALQLPIFNTGRGAVLRARAELEESQARLASVELAVRNEVALGLDRVATAREIAERYRTALVPQREAVVQRELERYNFMLGGVFELLQAKRAEFDAYQEYLESVRDYWVARTELRRAAGGKLPGDEQKPEATIGVEDVLTPNEKDMKDMDHSPMGHPTDHEAQPPAGREPVKDDSPRKEAPNGTLEPDAQHGDHPPEPGENLNGDTP